MFSVKQFIILSAMVCVAYCAVGIYPSAKSTTKEGFCEFNETFIKQGESQKIGEECVNYECNTDYTIRSYSCSPFRTDKCIKYADKDLSAPYPTCCEQKCIEFE